MHFYFPITYPFFLMLFLLLVFVVILIEINVLGYAYERAGISRRYVFLVLFASLVGSYINIPVWQLPAEHLLSGRAVDFYGMQYVIPMVIDAPGTIIAFNLGAIEGLGAPVASIGGAGTYDGIFLTGIVSVLLASIFSPRRRTAA